MMWAMPPARSGLSGARPSQGVLVGSIDAATERLGDLLLLQVERLQAASDVAVASISGSRANNSTGAEGLTTIGVDELTTF